MPSIFAGTGEVMNETAARLLSVTMGLAGVSWGACGGEVAPGPADDRAPLAAALEGRRLLEPRLTGGFPHAPCRHPGRVVCGTLPGLEEPSFAAILRALAEAPRSRGGAVAADLLEGASDPVRVGRAVAALEDSTASREDAAGLSDLAAAYLVRSELQHDPLDLLRAATAALSAVDAAPNLPEARFNLALALQKLSAIQATRVAWEEYLRIDDGSGWPEEARERLRALPDGGGGPRSGRREDRERALEELLPSWADRYRTGRHEAASQVISEARSLGRRLAPDPGRGTTAGDGLVQAVVLELDRAPPRRRESLVDAWLAYGRGIAAYRLRDNQRADREFAGAANDFGGSAASGWAAVGRALATFQQGRYSLALSFLDEVSDDQEESYPALSGRIWWIRGTIAILQDRPADAYAAYRRSVERFERAEETGSRVAVEIRWAAALASQGAHDEAWRRRLRVLREAPLVSSAKELQVVYMEVAHAALTAGHPSLALIFLDEALVHLRTDGDPAAETIVRRWRAAALDRLNRGAEAGEELALTRRLLPAIVDPEQRTLGLAEVELQEAALLRESDPAAVVELLSDAIARLRRSSHLNLLPRAYLNRARSHRRLNREASAAADLEAAIGLIEGRRANAQSATDRAWFLADVREIYEEAVDLEARAGRTERAFRLADALHGRVLDDALRVESAGREADVVESGARGLPVSEIRSRLPEGSALLAFLALPDRLLRWSVDRDGVRLDELAVPAEDLDRQVRRLLAAVQAGDRAGARGAGRFLSAALLGSTEGLPKDLFLVPDRALHDLPFDLLTHPETGRLLVEATTITIVPSASVFGRIAAREQQRGSLVTDSVLIVADPSFSPQEFPGLSRLPGARSESTALAGLYAGSEVLSAEAASAEAMLAALDRHRVVHVAAHAVPSAGDPRLSYLVLSDGPLYARQVVERRLEEVRVVVLSACSTGRRSGTAGEGLAGLSQAFLEAGAAAVVGTLWPVDDRASVLLTAAFHKHLLADADPAAALRSAKLERLRAGDPPAVWAAFEVIGAPVPRREIQ